jgi:hypothetical protein
VSDGDGGETLEISVASDPETPRGTIQSDAVTGAVPTVVGLSRGKPKAIDFIR